MVRNTAVCEIGRPKWPNGTKRQKGAGTRTKMLENWYCVDTVDDAGVININRYMADKKFTMPLLPSLVLQMKTFVDPTNPFKNTKAHAETHHRAHFTLSLRFVFYRHHG